MLAHKQNCFGRHQPTQPNKRFTRNVKLLKYFRTMRSAHPLFWWMYIFSSVQMDVEIDIASTQGRIALFWLKTCKILFSNIVYKYFFTNSVFTKFGNGKILYSHHFFTMWVEYLCLFLKFISGGLGWVLIGYIYLYILF